MTTIPNEHPWLAKAPVVRAILRGHQTQDRRPFLAADAVDYLVNCDGVRAKFFKDGESFYKALPWQPGTHIWVRETFRPWHEIDADCGCGGDYCLCNTTPPTPVCYAADCNGYIPPEDCEACGIKWTPSIFMPREYSRITLLVKRVWVERLQSITEKDAIAEGVVQPDLGTYGMNPETLFRDLWNSCYPDPALQWDANPWVIATEFERITP